MTMEIKSNKPKPDEILNDLENVSGIKPEKIETRGRKKKPDNELKSPRRKPTGGVPGMHSGHSYKPECMCIICKQARAKLQNVEIKEPVKVETHEKFIKPYSKNIATIEITPENLELLSAKVPQLKNEGEYTKEDYNEFISLVCNSSINIYLKSIK